MKAANVRVEHMEREAKMEVQEVIEGGERSRETTFHTLCHERVMEKYWYISRREEIDDADKNEWMQRTRDACSAVIRKKEKKGYERWNEEIN